MPIKKVQDRITRLANGERQFVSILAASPYEGIEAVSIACELALEANVLSAFCKHAHLGIVSCEAFPSRIPGSIKHGEYDHFLPYPGDNGIRFEPKDENGPPAQT